MAIFSACRSAPAVRPLQLVDYTYFARSPGIQYGGHINISHLAVYGPTTAAPPFAVFDFGASGARQATIVERQNMQSVSIRCMIVVKVLVLFSVCVCEVCVMMCVLFSGAMRTRCSFLAFAHFAIPVARPPPSVDRII